MQDINIAKGNNIDNSFICSARTSHSEKVRGEADKIIKKKKDALTCQHGNGNS